MVEEDLEQAASCSGRQLTPRPGRGCGRPGGQMGRRCGEERLEWALLVALQPSVCDSEYISLDLGPGAD